MSRTPSFNLIGAGIVGRVIAKLLLTYKKATIASVVNSTYHSSLNAIEFIGAGKAEHSIEDLMPADITFIGTDESHIEKIVNILVNYKKIKPKSIVVHFSGILPGEILNSAHTVNAYIARIHPIKHMKDSLHAITTFKGTCCTFEGDVEALAVLMPIFECIGAIVYPMKKQYDCKYHAASVLACVYPQILVATAAMLYEECGLDKGTSLGLANRLALSSLQDISFKDDYSTLVEGPIQRSDVELIKKHIQSLKKEPFVAIYKALGHLAVLLTHHDQTVKEQMYKELSLN